MQIKNYKFKTLSRNIISVQRVCVSWKFIVRYEHWIVCKNHSSESIGIINFFFMKMWFGQVNLCGWSGRKIVYSCLCVAWKDEYFVHDHVWHRRFNLFCLTICGLEISIFCFMTMLWLGRIIVLFHDPMWYGRINLVPLNIYNAYNGRINFLFIWLCNLEQ